MIDHIRGRCLRKSPTGVVIEVGGLGLSVAVPLSSSERLGAVGSEVTLLTYLHVREDILELYGFSTAGERDMFALLIKVSGIGPKMALAILSRFSPDELFSVVSDGDFKLLTTVKGIGKRTAERLMLDLRSVIDRRFEAPVEAVRGKPSPMREAMHALEALGFTLQQADDAVRKAHRELGDDSSVEELVRTALKG